MGRAGARECNPFFFSLVLQNVVNIFVRLALMNNWVSVSEPHTSLFNCDFFHDLSYVVPYILDAVI